MNDIRQAFKKSLHITVPLILAVFTYMFVNYFSVISKYIHIVNSAMKPFIIGFFIAFLLCAPLNFFEKKYIDKLNITSGKRRALSIITVYTLTISAIVIILMLILPQIVESIRYFAQTAPDGLDKFILFVQEQGLKFPELYSSLQTIKIDYEVIMTWVKDTISNVVPHLLEMTGDITKGVYNILIGIIASIYMLATKEKFAYQARQVIFAILDGKVAKKVIEVGRYSSEIFTRFLIGKIIDSIIIGILCAILMTIFKMPYTILISFIIGVTNIIPFFGPFIGAIPGVIIILTVDPITACWFALLILGLQQFDGNILGPKILGDSTGLSSFWVFFAIIIFGNFYGFLGMLLGVPVFAVMYRLINEFVGYRLSQKNIDRIDV